MKEQDILHIIQRAIERKARLVVERSDDLSQGHCQFIGHLSWSVPGKVDQVLHIKGGTIISCMENLVWAIANQFVNDSINPIPRPTTMMEAGYHEQ